MSDSIRISSKPPDGEDCGKKLRREPARSAAALAAETAPVGISRVASLLQPFPEARRSRRMHRTDIIQTAGGDEIVVEAKVE
jgi:hypothetical protein